LLCRDSANVEVLDRLLNGAKIQLCNTHPPYNVKVEPPSENAIAAGNSSFTLVRDSSGVFYQHVADTDRPIVIRRYRDQSVVMFPLWEWRWFKQL
jgi:hypothetical protein